MNNQNHPDEKKIVVSQKQNLTKSSGNSRLTRKLLDRANKLQQKKPDLGLIIPSLKKFDFETVKVNTKGEIIKRIQASSQYFTEDLGNGVTLDMVSIPGGEFIMGTDDAEIERLCQKFNRNLFKREAPQHKVTIKPFFMAKYLITQAQWEVIASRNDLKVKDDLNPNPAHFKGENNPVERVSWHDAVEFCARLSRLTTKEYKLPSEAQWEYGCRAGTETSFYCGETITSELANHKRNYTYADEPQGIIYRKKTTSVGEFPPNGFGLYDMHGNLWEWCEDDWHNNYENAPSDGKLWIDKNSKPKVLRGGSWLYYPYDCRSAYRSINNPSFGLNSYGLRVVCG